MHQLTSLILFSLISSAISQRHPNGCDIDILKLKDPEPIFFIFIQSTQQYQFKEPECGMLSFQHTEVFYTSCDRNTFTTITCFQRNFFINNQPATINQVTNCNNVYPEAKVVAKQESCPYGYNALSQLLSVGFYVNSPTGIIYLELYEICHNFVTLSPVYVHYLIQGQSITMKMKSVTKSMTFKKGSPVTLPITLTVINNYYKDASVKMRKELGQAFADTYKIGSKEISFARGHLARSSDFALTAWKRATYFYENVMPQWTILNGAVWNQVENAAQQIALYERGTVNVFVFAMGILTLPGVNGDDNPIYLGDSSTIAAPKFIHKIIKNSHRFYHFVVSNCPFYSATEVLCEEYVCQRGDDAETLNEFISAKDKKYNELGYVKSCFIQSLNDIVNN